MRDPVETAIAIVAMKHLQKECRQLALRANMLSDDWWLKAVHRSIENRLRWLDRTCAVAGPKLLEQVETWQEQLAEFAKGVS
jgi:hypothetical protein